MTMWPVPEGGTIPTRLLDNFTVTRVRTGELLQLLDLPYTCAPGTAEVRGTVGGPRGTGQPVSGSFSGWGIHTSVGFNAAPPQPWVLVGNTVWPLGQCAPQYLESYMPCIGFASVLNAAVQVISCNPPDPFYRVQQLLSAKSMDKQLLVAWAHHIRHHLAPMASQSRTAQLFLQQMEFSHSGPASGPVAPPVQQAARRIPAPPVRRPDDGWGQSHAPATNSHGPQARSRLGTWSSAAPLAAPSAQPQSPTMLPTPPRIQQVPQIQPPVPTVRPPPDPSQAESPRMAPVAWGSPEKAALPAPVPSSRKRWAPSAEFSAKRQRTNLPHPPKLPLSSFTGVIEGRSEATALPPVRRTTQREPPVRAPPLKPPPLSSFTGVIKCGSQEVAEPPTQPITEAERRPVRLSAPPDRQRPVAVPRTAYPRPQHPSIYPADSLPSSGTSHPLHPLRPKPTAGASVFVHENEPVALVPRPSKRRQFPDEELDSGDLECLPSEPFAVTVALSQEESDYDITGALLMLCQFLAAFGHVFDITPPSLRYLHKMFCFPLHELTKRPLGVLTSLHQTLLLRLIGDKNFLLATIQESYSHADASELQPLRDAAMEDLFRFLSHSLDAENGMAADAVEQLCVGRLEDKAIAATALLRGLPIDGCTWTEALRLVVLFCDTSLIANGGELKEYLLGDKDYYNLRASSRLRLADLLMFLVLETDAMRQIILEASEELADLHREDRQASQELREKQLEDLQRSLEKLPRKEGDAEPHVYTRQKLLEIHNNDLRKKKLLARQLAVNGDLSGLTALSEYGERGEAVTAKDVLRRKEAEFTLQSSIGAVLLGEDRLFRRYWLLDLPVEPTLPIGLGIAIEQPPSSGSKSQKWAFCMTAKSLGRLLRYLNRMGMREKALASQLEYWMPLISSRLSLVRSAVRTFCDESLPSSPNTPLPLPWQHPESMSAAVLAEDCSHLVGPLKDMLSSMERGLDWLATTSAYPNGKKWRSDWIRALKQSRRLQDISALSVDLAEMLTESHGLLEKWWGSARAKWMDTVGSGTVTIGRLSLLLMLLDENVLLDCEDYPACIACGRSTSAVEYMMSCIGCGGYAHTFCAGQSPLVDDSDQPPSWKCPPCSGARANGVEKKAKEKNAKEKKAKEKKAKEKKAKEKKAKLPAKAPDNMSPSRKRRSSSRAAERKPTRDGGVRSSARKRKPTEKLLAEDAEDRQAPRKSLPRRAGRRQRRVAGSPSPTSPSDAGEPEDMDQSNDACEVCDDGGNLLCCETCPRVYHVKCAGLRRQPKGDWYCPACSNKK